MKNRRSFLNIGIFAIGICFGFWVLVFGFTSLVGGCGQLVPPGQIVVPSNVSSFSATRESSTVIKLTWTNPSENDIAGVKIFYSNLGPPYDATSWPLLTNEAGSSGEAKSYSITSGVTTEAYWFTIFAYNTAGKLSAGYLTTLEAI